MFSNRFAETLKRIVGSEEMRFSLTTALGIFSIEYNLGSVRGRSVYFSHQDKEEIKLLLIAKGYALTASAHSDMTRSERLAFTPNEKAGGRGLKRNRISIKAPAGKPLLLNGKFLVLPEMSHIDIDISAIETTGHDCVILVENYDNFNHIHNNPITLPQPFARPLVVYRGDKNESRLDSVLSYLDACKLPVFAYVDIDPYGLVNVQGLTNLVGVLTPERSILEALLSDTKTKRNDLYEKHYAGCYAVLDRLPDNHPCKGLWNLIKKYKAGVVQEQFLRLKLPIMSNGIH